MFYCFNDDFVFGFSVDFESILHVWDLLAQLKKNSVEKNNNILVFQFFKENVAIYSLFVEKSL